MKQSDIWEIEAKFRDLCKRRGWRTSETEDWVEVKDSYHHFIWVRDVHLSSFKRITKNNKCVVRDALTYRVIESSYTAWLFLKTPQQALVKAVLESADFSCKIALYDLSSLADGKSICGKLNGTDSSVFREFEDFLENEFKIKFEPLSHLDASETQSNACAVTEMT